MAAEPASHQPDLLRTGIPALAVLVAIAAVVADPGTWWQSGLLLLPTAALVVWARREVPPILLGALVVVPTVASQSSGELEPGLFLISVLALVITGWYPVSVATALITLGAVLAPIAIVIIQGGQGITWGIWVFGIAFPAFMGWASRRQEMLAQRLAQAERELTEQSVLEERRRIARDVHDLVGHGLAAMMLQVTGARHILHRNPAAADDALAAVEDAGRRSMQELRRTVAMLREGDSAIAAALPTVGQVEDLVHTARNAGLQVDYTVRGDPGAVDLTVGLTLYRIVQESLANASRHAPHAHTSVCVSITDADVSAEVRTTGPLLDSGKPDPERPRYGLRGMQERAEVVGGSLSAGAAPGGWLVRCAVPR